ncbi:hypothetical protein PR001_g7197 [Phytophthora rubi]|uniref:Uncharacterized protein n=1 Tax=Phytophthora rubi TaxID=129364 RepID=A0A6A3N9W5_9STRA|nr:hypothetical protein PR002_g18012 [Phytophthora rubi]KAE9040169.1 hypothetical protein PR001_g7197 [Phytophthora rubi]
MKRNREPDVLSDISQCPQPKRPKTNQNELLNVIFRFRHKIPSDCQDGSLCVTSVKHFAEFVTSLDPVTVSKHCCGRTNPLTDDRVVPISVFSEHEVEQLQEVRRRLETEGGDIHKRGEVWYDPWLPMYGCVLQKTKLNAAVVKLEVLFVDGWERTLHFLPTGECVHSAVPTTSHVLHCADLDSSLEEKFKKAFESKLLKAQQGRGSKRSAAVNDLGHQKTPQFIAAVVRRAVASVTSEVEDEDEDDDDEDEFEGDKRFAPHGGTTDVGQHTGGRPRDTCWPLVHAAISRNVCCGMGLLRKTTAMFQLSLLKKAVIETQGAFRRGVEVRSGCDSVDDLFFMLRVVVHSLVDLRECGYDISALPDECAALRTDIEELLGDLSRKTASRCGLPDSTALQRRTDLPSALSKTSRNIPAGGTRKPEAIRSST